MLRRPRDKCQESQGSLAEGRGRCQKPVVMRSLHTQANYHCVDYCLPYAPDF